jgi:homoserine O-acetyltransferase
MEWAIEETTIIQNLVLLATNAKHSAWGIAFNETQRMALELGEKGLEVARAIAMLSYRNYEMYSRTSKAEDGLGNYGASSYQRYQGKKLAQRFDSDSYRVLSEAMDSHNVGRERGSIDAALKLITANVLVIGISTDILFPPTEQELLQNSIPNAELKIIESSYGHDGFLTEGDLINEVVLEFLKDRNS